MDTLQKQLNTLSAKVDDLHQLIEQLGSRVSDIVTECKIGPDQTHHSELESLVGERHHRNYHRIEEHKDVLSDGDSIDSSFQHSERQLTPEIQIQRLTAQLTAAYSRIAALEEQLISKRIH